MKKTLIAAAALVAMVACNKNIIEISNQETGFGYINLGVSADTEMVVTKGVEATDATDLTGYNISVTGTQIEAREGQYENVKDNSEFWTVPAGTYTVAVENYTTEEAYVLNKGKGAVRVSGTSEVEVKAGLQSPCAIECKPINSKISFEYTEAFKEVFPTATVKAGTTERTFDFEMLLADSEGTPDVAYYEPTETIVWTLTATNSNDVVKTYTNAEKPQALKEGKWTVVTFTVGSTDGSINVTITVNGEITETDEVSAEIDPLGGTVVE